jgi:hypothetical protein
MPQRSPAHEPPLAAIAHNIGLAHALAPTSTDDFPAGARPLAPPLIPGGPPVTTIAARLSPVPRERSCRQIDPICAPELMDAAVPAAAPERRISQPGPRAKLVTDRDGTA